MTPSRIAPSDGETVEATGRLSMSPARRRRIIARSNGHCSYPECESADRLEIDHIVALFLGGKETDDNLAALCYDHHKQKTSRDARLAAKVRRLKIKQLPKEQQPKAQPIRSAGFRNRWERV